MSDTHTHTHTHTHTRTNTLTNSGVAVCFMKHLFSEVNMLRPFYQLFDIDAKLKHGFIKLYKLSAMRSHSLSLSFSFLFILFIAVLLHLTNSLITSFLSSFPSVYQILKSDP